MIILSNFINKLLQNIHNDEVRKQILELYEKEKKENVTFKISKTATKISLMDVKSALDYSKPKENGEIEYKGNIVFTINEYGKSKLQLSAYMSKKVAKTVFNSIKSHQFGKAYPNGVEDYGGSIKKKVARTIRINLDNSNRFVFTIEEGPGRVDEKGTIKMIKKEKSVQTFVSYEEGLKMAEEIYTFITGYETWSFINGSPLFSIVAPYKGNQIDESFTPSADYVQENYDVQVDENENSDTGNVYVIQIGNWKGKLITELESTTLETVIARLEPDTPEKIEFIEEAKKELAKR